MLSLSTEVEDYIRRKSVLSPDKDIVVIDHYGRTEIYSIDDDGKFYWTYEADGRNARFARKEICESAKEIAVTKVICKKTGAAEGDAAKEYVAIAYCDSEEVKIAVVENFEKCWKEKSENGEIVICDKIKKDVFKSLKLPVNNGAEGLSPDELQICALNGVITLFIEMKDEDGRIKQFSYAIQIVENDDTIPVDEFGVVNVEIDSVRYTPLATNFSSVICNTAGRAVDQWVDGIYTYGCYGSEDVLLYTQSRNVFSKCTEPVSIRLKSTFHINAICTLPLKNTAGTHLFAACPKPESRVKSETDEKEGLLILYPFERQKDMRKTENADPEVLVSSEYFYNAKKIAAVHFDNHVYVYVLNADGKLSFTFAEYDENTNTFVPVDEHTDEKFYEPVLLMDHVVYFDISHDGTMNVCTESSYVSGTRNDSSGEWMFEPVSIGCASDKFTHETAYVTRVATGVPSDEIKIKADGGAKLCCYINDVFYKFNEFTTKTDERGNLRIAQIATDLSPTCFTISHKAEKNDLKETEEIHVNPAEESQGKILSLQNKETMRNLEVVDPAGKTEKLFDDKVSDDSLGVVAQGVQYLNEAKTNLTSGDSSPDKKLKSNFLTEGVKEFSFMISSNGLRPYQEKLNDLQNNRKNGWFSKIVKDLSYAFKWVAKKIEKGIECAVNFICDKVNKVFNFVIKIAGKVLTVVVDAVGKVLSTAVHLLEMIGVPIGKLFNWLKKLLHIEDAERANDYLKKMMQVTLDSVANSVERTCKSFVDKLDYVQNIVNNWIGNASGISTDVKNDGGSCGFDGSTRGMFMFETIFGVFDVNSMAIAFPISRSLQTALGDFCKCVDSKKSKFPKMDNDSIENIISRFTSISNLNDFLNSLKAVLADIINSGFDACKTIISSLSNVIKETIEAIKKFIFNPIGKQLPLLSSILKIFGVEKFCLADIVTFPTAFLVNIVHEITAGKPIVSEDLYMSVENANCLDDFLGIKKVPRVSSNVIIRDVLSEENEPMCSKEFTIGKIVYLNEGKKNALIVFKSFIVGSAVASTIVSGCKAVKGSNDVLDGIAFIASSEIFACTLVSSFIYDCMGEAFSGSDLPDEAIMFTCIQWAFSCINIVTTTCCEKKDSKDDEKFLALADLMINLCLIAVTADQIHVVNGYKTEKKDIEKEKKLFICDSTGVLIGCANNLTNDIGILSEKEKITNWVSAVLAAAYWGDTIASLVYTTKL